MGLPKPIARPILQEHKYKPLTGKGLFIGRQSVHFSVDDAMKMIKEEKIPMRGERQGKFFDVTQMVDRVTRYFADKGHISDTAFFSLFSDLTFQALDVSDYEGAEIVHDMQTPVPKNLEGQFDFIYNGSCMDNMSDAMTAMKNMAKMLKTGGRLVSIEMGTPHHNAYTIFSPAWFFDYCAINNFKDCKVYVGMFNEMDVHTGPFHFFTWQNFNTTLKQFPYHNFPAGKASLIYVIAEKDVDSTWDKSPIQGQYRQDHAPYLSGWERFSKSDRPLLIRDWDRKARSDYHSFLKSQQDEIRFVGSF